MRRGSRRAAALDVLELPRDGRREQEGLTPRGQEREDGGQLAAEAEVEHLIGLVEDEIPYGAEARRVLGREVEKATGRGHEDIGPPRRESIWALIELPP